MGMALAASAALLYGCKAGDGRPEWKHGVVYEIFVRSFYDSNGDGIGDLRGIIEKLDYLNDGDPDSGDDLGVDGIWLMPIYPSPTYHGYDVTDYYAVNPDYGTLDDFRELAAKAHARGIKVFLDLPINNTSSQHPWFTEAASNPDSPYRDWFIWAEDRGLSVNTVGAFGTNPWHAANGSHYLGIYHDSMPDLNYDQPAVREEMIRIGKFWLEQGADGFRLDSAKHIYWKFANSGADPETSRNNVKWWRQFREGLREVHPDVYLVGEVWDTNSVIAPFLDGALDSGFNFDLAAKLVELVRSGKAQDLGFWLKRVHDLYDRISGGAFVDAPFLTNHDQNRVMSQLGGDVNRAKAAAALLLTLPGNPFIYYGEEIGMAGEKPDEQIREPMVWEHPTGADAGQTRWRRHVHVPPPSVAEQSEREDSLLARYKMLIRWRGQKEALRSGRIDDFDSGEHPHIVAFVRYTEQERLLVAHNLSNSAQTIDLVKDRKDRPSYSEVILFTEDGWELSGGALTLPPYGSAVLK